MTAWLHGKIWYTYFSQFPRMWLECFRIFYFHWLSFTEMCWKWGARDLGHLFLVCFFLIKTLWNKMYISGNLWRVGFLLRGTWLWCRVLSVVSFMSLWFPNLWYHCHHHHYHYLRHDVHVTFLAESTVGPNSFNLPPVAIAPTSSSTHGPPVHPGTGHMCEVASQPNLAALFKAGGSCSECT